MADIEIAGAVLDKERLTLYKTDGTSLIIPQGDPRLKTIVEKILPVIQAGGIAYLNDDVVNNFAAFQKKAGGIKFFRVLKSAVAHIFHKDEDEQPKPFSAGTVPSKAPVQNPTAQAAAAQQVQATRAETVLNQKAGATPAPKKPIPVLGAGLLTPERDMSRPGYQHTALRDDETIVAAVGDKVVPGMEKLEGQFRNISAGANPGGVAKLIERLSAMIDKRAHSVEDILKFLEGSDLQVADNGDIIAYKLVQSTTRHSDKVVAQGEGIFYDCHSQMVPQRLGSVVCVDESMVDKNRRNDCSNGLHVATRAYLAGFSGDTVLQIRVAPEDVIVVPHGDARKVRVCRYHIVGILSKRDYENLKAGRAMTDNPESQTSLAKVLAGDHVGRLEEVRITGQQGQGVVITAIAEGHDISGMLPITKTVNAAPTATAIPEPASARKADPVDPKAVAVQAAASKPAAVKPVQGSARQIEAARLHGLMTNGDYPLETRQRAARDLKAFKSKAKVSWSALMLPEDTSNRIQSISDLVQAPTAQAPKAEPVKAAPKAAPAPKAPTQKASKPTVGAREQLAQSYYSEMTDTKRALSDRQASGRKLKELKTKAKVSWEKLGFDTSAVVDEIDGVLSQQVQKETMPKKATPAPKPIESAPKAAPAALKAAEPTKGRQQQAADLYDVMVNGTTAEHRRRGAEQLKALKAKAKVSWVILGLKGDVGDQIQKVLDRNGK